MSRLDGDKVARKAAFIHGNMQGGIRRYLDTQRGAQTIGTELLGNRIPRTTARPDNFIDP